MNQETATIIFNAPGQHIYADLEVPLNITANDLVIALNEGYDLGIDVTNIRNCYLKSEMPIALLRGDKALADFGVRNGTIVTYTS